MTPPKPKPRDWWLEQELEETNRVMAHEHDTAVMGVLRERDELQKQLAAAKDDIESWKIQYEECYKQLDLEIALFYNIVYKHDELKAKLAVAVEALRYYASDEAWTIDQVEGFDGDYGGKAREALAKIGVSDE